MNKRIIAVILAAVMLAASLSSCAGTSGTTGASVRVTSSDAKSAAAWLGDRLGDKLTGRVVLGTNTDGYGVDLSTLETDGYVIRSLGNEIALFAKTAEGLDRAVRRYAKAVEAGDPVADETYREGARIDRVTLAGNDISEYAIRVEGDGEYLKNRVTGQAAQGFSDLMFAACGVRVPFGDAPHAVIFREIADESFGEASFHYFIKDGDLVFEYVELQGANYGVWSFFEDQLGWEEIACGETYLREAEHIDVSEGTERRVDPLFRSGFFAYDGYSFNTQRAINRTVPTAALSAMYGYKYRIPVAMHGMQSMKWAGMDVQGAQICYTDESMYRYAADAIWTYISNRVEAGAKIGEGFDCIDIAQGDNFGYCGCEHCKKLFAEEGGANSGLVVRWANRLAAEMEDEGFGGLKYLIYAYANSNVPCKTKPRADVYVTYCTNGHCSHHYFDGSQCKWSCFRMLGTGGTSQELSNRDFGEWARGWGELCDSDNLYVWYYMLNNNVRSYTLIDRLWEDMHFLSDCGAAAVFVEGETYSGYGPIYLQHKLITELQLHPDISREDYRLLVGRVFENAFGDGWREVLAAMDLWEKAQIALQKCVYCWSYVSISNYDNLDGATFLADWDEMLSLLDAAIYKANSAKQETNVKRLSLSFLYNGCYYGYFPAYEGNDAEMLAKVSERYDLMIRRFAEVGLDHKSIIGLGSAVGSLGDTVEETAWTVWKGDRELFFAEGTELKPVPAGYAGEGD